MPARITRTVTTTVSSAAARTTRLARDIAGLAARGRWPSGRHVTELEVARALAVSRTPVRAALRVLEQHGALQSRPGRGFFLIRDGRTLPDLPLSIPATADDELRACVLRDRIAGDLDPSFTAGQLASRYHVGRMLLNRVLHRLAAEGLITREGGHGWRFLPTLEGAAGVRASYELRILVEPAGLLLPDARIDPEVVRRERRRHEEVLERLSRLRHGRGLSTVLLELDVGFHQALADFSGNYLIANVVRQQNALRRLLEFNTYRDARRVLGWVREHLSILEALERGSVETASVRLREHLGGALSIALESIR